MGKIVKISVMFLKNDILREKILVVPCKILAGWDNFEKFGKEFRFAVSGKNPGGQKFWQQGGRFREIISYPPKNMCCPSNAPQISRPDAATIRLLVLLSLKSAVYHLIRYVEKNNYINITSDLNFHVSF